MRHLLTVTAALATLLLCLPVGPAWAAGPPDPEDFGDWVVLSNDRADWAVVVNDSAASFALRCDGEQKCFWAFTTKMPCTTGVKLNTLVALVGVGSRPLTAHCIGTLSNGDTRLALGPFDDIDAMVRDSKAGDTIGFAYALEGGQFLVSRFSLRGVQAALARLEQRTQVRTAVPPPRAPRAPTKDQIL